MRERALERNPDEFYFAMQNAKLNKVRERAIRCRETNTTTPSPTRSISQDGKHRKLIDEEKFSHDELLLMDNQDAAYLTHHQLIEERVREAILFVLFLFNRFALVEIGEAQGELARTDVGAAEQAHRLCRRRRGAREV